MPGDVFQTIVTQPCVAEAQARLEGAAVALWRSTCRDVATMAHARWVLWRWQRICSWAAGVKGVGFVVVLSKMLVSGLVAQQWLLLVLLLLLLLLWLWLLL